MTSLFTKVLGGDRKEINPRQSFYSEFLGKFDQNTLEALENPGVNRLFKAKHNLDEGLFVIKVIPFVSSDSEDDKLLAFREVRMLRELEHPNILRYYFSWVEEPPGDFKGYPPVLQKWVETNPVFLFILTEFCQEGSLDKWIKEKGRYRSLDLKHELICDVVNGLCYIHSMKKIHRDLKPANIFLKYDYTGRLRARIGDFGITRDLVKETMTRGGGTSLYSSPEQLSGTRYTEKTDIFPLGIILAEILYVHDKKTECESPPPVLSMEDIKIIRKGVLPENFCQHFSKDSKESSLIKSMLTGPEDRPSASDIKVWLNDNKFQSTT